MEKRIEEKMDTYFCTREEAIKMIEKEDAFIKRQQTQLKDFWERDWKIPFQNKKPVDKIKKLCYNNYRKKKRRLKNENTYLLRKR